MPTKPIDLEELKARMNSFKDRQFFVATARETLTLIRALDMAVEELKQRDCIYMDGERIDNAQYCLAAASAELEK